MEYVKGKDLKAMVKKGKKLPVAEAVNYMLQAAQGMEYAHSRHIIHRDIKPSNLLLATPEDSDARAGQYSRVKILDMGLARLAQPDGNVVSPTVHPGSDLSATGMLMGTVDYMAPEQAMDTKRADHRSDIYSLGCTLYYLLTRKPLYTGNNLLERISALFQAHIPSLLQAPLEPVDPDQLETLEELDAVLQKMVVKKPKDRFQSMTEVVAALEQIDRQFSIGDTKDSINRRLLQGDSHDDFDRQEPGSSYPLPKSPAAVLIPVVPADRLPRFSPDRAHTASSRDPLRHNLLRRRIPRQRRGHPDHSNPIDARPKTNSVDPGRNVRHRGRVLFPL